MTYLKRRIGRHIIRLSVPALLALTALMANPATPAAWPPGPYRTAAWPPGPYSPAV